MKLYYIYNKHNSYLNIHLNQLGKFFKYSINRFWLKLLAMVSCGLFISLLSYQHKLYAQTTTSPVNVVFGWNLLGNGTSLPISVASTFGNAANVLSVWKWDAATSSWAFYAPSYSDGGAAYASAQGYEFLTSINPGDGYWVNATVAFSLTGSTTGIYSASNFVFNSATALLSGWNLISVGDGISASSFNSSLSSTAPIAGSVASNVNSIWAWDSANSAWYFYAPTLDANGSLSSFISNQGYKDFRTNNFSFQNGVGFWVNYPGSGVTAIKGTLSGLNSGNTISIANGSTSQTLAYNGSFSFTSTSGSSYNVTVAVQPNNQTCTVSHAAGTVSGSVNNIAITCISNPLKAQTITFSQPSTLTVGATGSLSASASSGLPVSFTSSSTGVCTVSGSSVIAIASGTCSVTASQGGSSAYTAASSVTQSFAVSLASQTISFLQPVALTVGGTQTLSATASSGLPLSSTSSTTEVCSVSGSMVNALAPGTCTITINQGGNNIYSAASSATRSFTVSLASQNITFAQPTALTVGAVASLSAFASSGLPVSFASTTNGICSISGSIVTAAAAGTCTITVNQAGNGTYGAAAGITKSFLVNLLDQTITFGQQAAQTTGTTLTLNATSSSGLPIKYTSGTTSVCTVSGSLVSSNTAGTCSITASQAGNSTYSSAVDITQLFTVKLASQNIVFNQSANLLSGNTLVLAATDSAGLTINYASLTPSVCSVTGDILTTLSSGICSVRASQPGNSIYAVAASVTDIFNIASGVLVSTLTGNGSVGDNDGSGSSASFSGPMGLAVDSTGAVYVADSGNNKIRQFDPANNSVITITGIGSVGAADGPISTSSFNNPSALALDKLGNMYVADYSNHKIRKISPAGNVTTFAGNGNSGTSDGVGAQAQFFNPSSIAIDSSGNVFVADSGNNKIRKINSKGFVSTFAGSGAQGSTDGLSTSSSFNGPNGVAVDVSGNVYVADAGNNKIRKITPSGVVSTIAGNGLSGISNGTGTSAMFFVPRGIAVDSEGTIYVADTGNNVVRKITSTGVVTTLAGSSTADGADGIGTLASFNNPIGLTLDAMGNLYVADYVNNKIRKITLTNSLAVQTITFNQPAIQTATSNLTLNASATSGLPVTYSSLTSNVCFVSGNLVTLLTAGTCSIVANQAGSSVFAAAPSVTQSFAVNLATQNITFPQIADQAATNSLKLTATATSNLPVTYISSTPNICFLSGSSLSLSVAGTCTITAMQAGNATYSSATNVSQSFSVNLAAQTITFTQIADQTATNTLTLTATTSSNLLISYSSSTPNVCSVFGNLLSLSAAGTCRLTATQPGNSAYSAALNVGQSFTVNSASQTITFSQPFAQVVGNNSTLVATTSSGLVIRFSTTSPNVCSISGNTVLYIMGGTCSITASQAGNGVYGAAPSVVQSFTVNLGNQFINFPQPANQIPGQSSSVFPGQSLNLNATSTANLVIAYISNTPNVCVILGNAVYVIASGYCSVTATQSGNSSYLAASSVTQTFLVNILSQTINFPQPSAQVAGTSLNLFATASSNLPISYLSLTPSVCSVTDNVLNFSYSGSCTVRANQSGSPAYSAAPSIDRTITVFYSSSANVSTFTGLSSSQGHANGDALATLFNYPFGVTVDSSGNVYVADEVINIIRKITPDGITTTFAGTPGYFGNSDGDANSARFYGPSAIVIDALGNLYVADTLNNSVRKITSDGFVTTLSGSFNNPRGLALDNSGNLYVSEFGNNNISKITSAGIVSTFAGSSSAGSANGYGTAASFNHPVGLAIDSNGNLYVADVDNGKIRKISTNGLVSDFAGTGHPWGSSDGVAASASFKWPIGIAIDSNGMMYVSDNGNNNIRQISNTGIVTTIAGSGAVGNLDGLGANALFNGPAGIAVSNDGVIYVADFYNHNVRAISKGLNNQTINFAQPNQTNAITFPLGAAASSGLVVSYYSQTNAVCSVLGQTLTLKMPGTCTVTARQLGNDTFAAAKSVAISFQINLVNQTINFNKPVSQSIGATTQLSATASSGLAVNFISTTPSICTVSGSTLSLISVGTCTITASQVGNSIYASATDVSQSFAVNLLSQYITFNQPLAQIPGAIFDLSASASSGLPISFSTNSPTICSVSGNTLSAISAGVCSIAASQSGYGNYAEAQSVSQSFSINFIAQTITFDQPAATNAGLTSLLSANASSNLPVNFATMTPSVCSTSGTTVTAISIGTCTVVASQAGNNTYSAAPPINQSFTVNVGTESINFSPLSDQVAGTTIALKASVTSGLPASYTSSTTSVCTISSYDVTFINTGTCTITANQAGNNSYLPAPTSSISFNVKPALVVSTIAGVVGSFGSADGAGSSASFNYPIGLTVDPAGNVYIADSSNNKIRKVDVNNIVTTVAGTGSASWINGAATSAGFNNPQYIVIAPSGNLYVSDTGNNEIREVNTNGYVYTIAGNITKGYANGTGSNATLYSPKGITVDPNGSLYVSEPSPQMIRKITISSSFPRVGTTSNYAWYGSNYGGDLGAVTGLASDPQGNIYATSNDKNGILKVVNGSCCSVMTLAGRGAYGNNPIYYAPGNADGFGRDATFNSPTGIAVDSSGNMFVADSGNNEIRKVTPAGLVTTIAGTGAQGAADGMASSATFNFPTGIAVDNSGNLFVSDTFNHTIRKIWYRSSFLPQNITFNQPVAQVVNTSVALSATSSSGLSVTFSSATPTICSISGSSAVLNSVGTCTVVASQVGDNTFVAAANISKSFIVIGTTRPSITFAQPLGLTAGTSANLIASASSGLSVNLTSLTPIVCSMNGNTVTALTAGTCTITATQTGNSSYPAATSVNRSFTVSLASQIITFNQPSYQIIGFTASLLATSSSNLSISYVSNSPTICTLSGSTVSVLATGTCSVTASQAGNGAYSAASSVTQTFAVMSNQSITFSNPGPQIAGNVSTLTATSNSGLSVTFSSLTTGVCSVSGTAVTPLTAGTCTIVAAQAGNSTYLAATNVTQSFSIAIGKVSTFAGSGAPGLVNGTGISASFNGPTGIAIDSTGNFFIADNSNNVIRKITQSGVVSTFAGNGTNYNLNGTGSAARFAQPWGVSLDSGGNIYVADSSNSVIRKITPSAVVSTLAGSGSVAHGDGTYPSLYIPTSVVVDNNGNVFVAGYGLNSILKVSINGNLTVFAGNGTAGSTNGSGATARFWNPLGLAIDSSNNLYVADNYNHLIRKITPAGVVTTIAGNGTAGNLNGNGTAASFNNPTGLAVDGTGNIYIADWGNNLIRKITPTGTVTTLAGNGTAGNSNGDLLSASFHGPWALVLDSVGNIYVADTYNHLIRKIAN
jgi:sugar lactone lactonase YvrE